MSHIHYSHFSLANDAVRVIKDTVFRCYRVISGYWYHVKSEKNQEWAKLGTTGLIRDQQYRTEADTGMPMSD
jgi:hypothetical protein